jgi:hypothetical protein
MPAEVNKPISKGQPEVAPKTDYQKLRDDLLGLTRDTPAKQRKEPEKKGKPVDKGDLL